MRLDGKVVVVTGAGRGLGRAYAHALANAGASVVVNDVDEDVANDVVAEISATGGNAVVEAVGVGSSEAAQRLVDRAVESFGRLDVMCTNAGILRDRTLWNATDEEFDLVIETHLRGTFTCARAAARRLREQGEGGSLILVGSPAGQRGNFGQTAYSAAKAGIVGFVRTWALELGRANISVNAVIPSALTRMVATVPGMEEMTARAEAGEPIPGRLRAIGTGLSEDVSGLVVFLASDAARTITGQAIGLGGDRLSLWTSPTEVVAAVRQGAWDADSIADAWPLTFAPELQSFGLQIPDVSGL